jgi:hypothetical protein
MNQAIFHLHGRSTTHLKNRLEISIEEVRKLEERLPREDPEIHAIITSNRVALLKTLDMPENQPSQKEPP